LNILFFSAALRCCSRADVDQDVRRALCGHVTTRVQQIQHSAAQFGNELEDEATVTGLYGDFRPRRPTSAREQHRCAAEKRVCSK